MSDTTPRHRHALERIYRAHRRALVACALVVTRCAALAEDAVHEAFARVLAVDRNVDDLRIYVFQAVRNAAIDAVKRARRSRVSVEPVEELLDHREGAEAVIQRDESRVELLRALLSLRHDERAVVALHVYGALTFREIAGVLERPESTVASSYYRALVRLRSRLTESTWKS